MGITALPFLHRGEDEIRLFMKQLFGSVKRCTNERVKDEENSRQIRKGKIVDLGLSCNWNVPTGIQFAENKLSELYSCEKKL